MPQTNLPNDNLLLILWQRKWLIIFVTIISAAIAVYIALSLPNKYRAEILLASSESESGGISDLASQFGGIASIAGLSLPSGTDNKMGKALALLKSRAFIQRFIEERELLPELLALEAWDEENDKLVFDPSVYDIDKKVWTRKPPPGKEIVPTSWEGYEAFAGMLRVGEVTSDSTLIIAMETLSPQLSQIWLKWLVDEINKTIANKELTVAQVSIDYLQQQIANTQIKELQSIFYSLIEEQTKKILLGEVKQDYVFEVLAEPVFPEDRNSPNRALITLVITFLGGIVSIFIVLLIHVFGRRPDL
jgi:uncharacterized protein involved in exopolysaccharide biosynthesis